MKRKLAPLFAVIIVCCFLFPAHVMADAREDAVDFVITINTDGSADFTETHTIEFSDDWDYTIYGRIYLYPQERTFGGWAVSVDGEPWRQLPEVDEDARPDGTFAVEYNYEGAVVTMYHRSNDTYRSFSLSYHVENAVDIYEDTAEFFWDLSSNNEISTIGEMTAKVILPADLNEDQFRIWAHGPLNGTFTKDGGNTASLAVEWVDTGNPVDIRIAMPAEIFTGGNYIGGKYLQKILDEEQGLADKANAEREEYLKQQAEYERWQKEWAKKHPIQAWVVDHMNLATGVFLVSLYGLIPFAGIYVFIRQFINKRKIEKLRKKPAISPGYYRSLPDGRPPALAGFLAEYYSGKNYGNYFTATMMDLSLKGHISMSGNGRDVFVSFRNSTVPLLPHEKVVYEMLGSSGDRINPVSLKQFQRKINRQPEWAIAQRNSFNSLVEQQFKETAEIIDLTKKPTTKQTLKRLLILGAIGFILLGPFAAAFLNMYITFGERIIAGLIGFGIGALWGIVIRTINNAKRFTVLSERDEESLSLWQAFGRFLDDFTLFEEKELPEFPVWKDYLTYAVALGKGRKLIKELELRYPSAMSDLGNQDGTYFAVLCYNGRMNYSLFRNMDNIQRSAYRAGTGGSFSSGGGGGGGFSSGSGGGGSGSGGGFAR